MVSLIGAIVTGLVVGGTYRFIRSGGRSAGMTPTMVVAVVGAVIGRFAGKAMFENSRVLHLLLAVVGATIAMAIYRAVSED